MNEDSLLGDRRHDTLVDEGSDELSRRRLVDIRRRHSDCIPILSEQFGFESLVIGCRSTVCLWTKHGISQSGTHDGAPHTIRRRQSPSTLPNPPQSPKSEKSILHVMENSRTPLTSSEETALEALEQYLNRDDDEQSLTRDDAITHLIDQNFERADAESHIEQLLLKGYLYEVNDELRMPSQP